jgi:antitoxin component of MazEF toxin-antitoxin module
VQEDYQYYKDHSVRALGLLELMSGHRPVAISATGEEFYDDFECPLPKQTSGSTVSSVSEKNHSEHYYDYTRNDPNRKSPFETKNGVTYSEYTKAKIEANSTWNDGWTKQHYQKIVDKYEGKQPKKWVLPVEEVRDEDTDEDIYCVTFPDDLLEAADLKEGDEVEWVEQGDGSALLKKVVKPMTYDDMIAAGYTMTADGFWIKE